MESRATDETLQRAVDTINAIIEHEESTDIVSLRDEVSGEDYKDIVLPERYQQNSRVYGMAVLRIIQNYGMAARGLDSYLVDIRHDNLSGVTFYEQSYYVGHNFDDGYYLLSDRLESYTDFPGNGLPRHVLRASGTEGEALEVVSELERVHRGYDADANGVDL